MRKTFQWSTITTLTQTDISTKVSSILIITVTQTLLNSQKFFEWFNLNDGRDNSNYMQNSLSLSISSQNCLDILDPFENDLNKIKMQRLEHCNTLIIGHFIINSIRSKFEMIAETITNFDILLILKSKNRFNFQK